GGVRYPIDAAQDFVVRPLRSVQGDAALSSALDTWSSASSDQQTAWAEAYVKALGDAGNDPVKAAQGDYGPVPTMAQAYEKGAASGGLEELVSKGSLYVTDPPRPLLLLADGSHLEDQARA